MLIQFLWLLAAHWVGDFVLQTHWQAQNKSKDIEALLRHVGTYTVLLAGVTPFIFVHQTQTTSILTGMLFVVTNGCLHFGTDYFTSPWTARYFGKDWHKFFVVMGFDQLIHHITLGATVMVFFK